MSVSARLAEPTDQQSLQIRMQWDFYDPADPANSGVNAQTPPTVVLYREAMLIDPSDASVDKITTRLVNIALRVNLAQLDALSLNQNVPAGTVVPLV